MQNTDKYRKEKYKKHLQSKYWSEFRKRYLKDHCQNCGNRYALDGHHKTYLHFGNEKQYPGDIVTLCRRCHDRIHFNIWGRRRKDWKRYSNQRTPVHSISASSIMLFLLFLFVTALLFHLFWRGVAAAVPNVYASIICYNYSALSGQTIIRQDKVEPLPFHHFRKGFLWYNSSVLFTLIGYAWKSLKGDFFALCYNYF